MRERILRMACCAYPRTYRSARGRELVDTALEATGRSAWALARESSSLLAAGLATRARRAGEVTARETLASAALTTSLILAAVNCAVAIAALTARVHFLDVPAAAVYVSPAYGPYAIDWWWITFSVLGVGVVAALLGGRLRVATILSHASFALVAFDAATLANDNPTDGRGHFDVFTYTQTSSFPGGREWVAASAILALATVTAARLRAQSRRQPVAIIVLAGLSIIVLALTAKGAWGAFFFLRFGLLVLVGLALVLGPFFRPLPLVASAATLAALPSVVAYLTAPNLSPTIDVSVAFAMVMTTGIVAPLVVKLPRRVARRRR